MKIALIGAGKCSEYWVSAANFCGTEIVAVCDTMQKNLADSPVKLKFDSLDELLSSKLKFDIAAVLTPPASHYEIIVNLVEHGIDTIVEKPVSNCLTQIENLFNTYNKLAFISCAYHAAHARDLNYFLENREILEKGMGNLIRFDCSFFDPYVNENKLKQQAAVNLGGSYLDSCVNALSVIERIIGLKELKALNFSKELLNYNNFQSEINYTNGWVCGTIQTNWLLNKNYKCTTLTYKQGAIVLQHSEQKIIVNKRAEQEYIIDCSENRPRLLNHYIGVLTDLKKRLARKETNLKESLNLHSILLSGKPYDIY